MQLLSYSQINELFEKFDKFYPYPKTELKYCNNYTLLIAIILSANSRDRMVNKVTSFLFEHVQTPEKMLNFGENRLKNCIRSLGLFNIKTRYVITISKVLVNKFYSKVPNSFDELLKLPGVGEKTANLFLNIAFNSSRIAVDTHVFRLSNRIGLCNTICIKQTIKELNIIIPTKWRKNFNNWLVLHGKNVCIARLPKCFKCFINDICNYFYKKITFIYFYVFNFINLILFIVKRYYNL